MLLSPVPRLAKNAKKGSIPVPKVRRLAKNARQGSIPVLKVWRRAKNARQGSIPVPKVRRVRRLASSVERNGTMITSQNGRRNILSATFPAGNSTEVKEKSLLLALHLLHSVPSVPVNRTPPPQMKPRVRAGVLLGMIIIPVQSLKQVGSVVKVRRKNPLLIPLLH